MSRATCLRARQPLPPQEFKELNSSYSLAEDLKEDLCREKGRLCGEQLKEHVCGEEEREELNSTVEREELNSRVQEELNSRVREELDSTVCLAEALSLAGRHRHV